MKLVIGMPYSELVPTANDNMQSIERLQKHLTVSITKYANMEIPTTLTIAS